MNQVCILVDCPAHCRHSKYFLNRKTRERLHCDILTIVYESFHKPIFSRITCQMRKAAWNACKMIENLVMTSVRKTLSPRSRARAAWGPRPHSPPPTTRSSLFHGLPSPHPHRLTSTLHLLFPLPGKSFHLLAKCFPPPLPSGIGSNVTCSVRIS